jgi:predicted PurR-regulated permease PerM
MDDDRTKTRAASARSSYVELLAQILVSLLIVAAVVLLLRYVGIIFGPILISLLLAYILHTLISWLERRGIGRMLAVVVVGGTVLLAIAGFAFLFVPALVQELGTVFATLPEQVNLAVREGQLRLARQLGIKPEQLQGAISNLGTQIERMLESAATGLLSAAASIFNLVLIPIFTIYFLRQWNTIVQLPLRLVPERLRHGVTQRARVIDRTVGGWIRGQITVALALGVLMAFALTATGLRLGFAIGVLTGLLNFIPYLGAAIGLFLAIVMALVDGGTLLYLALVAGVFIAVQLFESHVLTPWLVGGQVGMGPVAVLIVLLVGGTLFGFIGLLLAIPATGVAAVVAHDLIQIYRTTDLWRGSLDDGPIARQLLRPPTYAPLGRRLTLEHQPLQATPALTSPAPPTEPGAGVAPTSERPPAVPAPGAEPVDDET